VVAARSMAKTLAELRLLIQTPAGLCAAEAFEESSRLTFSVGVGLQDLVAVT